jgi:hypothetical protein
MSVDYHKHPVLPIPDIRLGARFTSFRGVAGAVGALSLLLCCAGFFFNREEFFHSYLFAYLYWVGFAFGGLGILLMNNVVGGRWGVTTRSFLIAASRTLPAMLLLFIPFFFGMDKIWPWADVHKLHADAFLWHKRHYLNTPFFWIRVAG